MLLPALFISSFTMIFALRVAVGYSRSVAAMKRLNEEDATQLPVEVREALSSRWSGSWQSQVFHEIAIGDITWAAKLSLGPTLAATRRYFRWMIIGITGVLVVLFLQLLLSR